MDVREPSVEGQKKNQDQSVENFHSLFSNLFHPLKKLISVTSEGQRGAATRFFHKWRGLALVVVLPMVVTGSYYLFWVSDRYVSTTQLIVKDSTSSQAASPALGFLVPGIGADTQDAFLVVNYIQSLDMALYLDEKLSLADYYKSSQHDIFSRLANDATQEDYLDYYRAHTHITYDEVTGIITMEMQAFNPAFAKRLIETAIQKSEDFVNAISNQLADKQVSFVKNEVELAQGKLRSTKQEILDFQNSHKIVSPEELTKGISTIIQGLEASLAEQRAKLTSAKTYLNTDSSQIISMKADIDALENQIEMEKVRLVGVGEEEGEQRLNSLGAHFQNLELDLQFATDAYAASLKALETARMEASGKLKHLMVVTQPSLAEKAEYPHKLYNLTSLAIVLLMLYGIGRMLVVTIRDHRM
ncbi:hypothetical protein BTJ40_04280 [Microbulbifer sp. A4B17]|uniref:hypothetical protein n=1 Tax=Microbulbifer sp. A4B17 TaxID=359370 RepID=UPI000D52E159|nr:hypothetical protein [Microbulbifer sp. A4B17]AWF80096.1 hypothetical protein BTJ40_04280 [Microbulbifer sp. A4B17]